MLSTDRSQLFLVFVIMITAFWGGYTVEADEGELTEESSLSLAAVSRTANSGTVQFSAGRIGTEGDVFSRAFSPNSSPLCLIGKFPQAIPSIAPVTTGQSWTEWNYPRALAESGVELQRREVKPYRVRAAGRQNLKPPSGGSPTPEVSSSWASVGSDDSSYLHFSAEVGPESESPLLSRAEISPALLDLHRQHSQLLCTLRPGHGPGGEIHRDLFEMRPEPVDLQLQALSALGEKFAYRELRRYFRSSLRDQFEADPSMGMEDYLDRRSTIGQIGRHGRAEDIVIDERVTELRNEFLDASAENPERDVPILQWGPLILDDRGGLSVDVFDLEAESDLSRFDQLALAPDRDRVAFGRGYGESLLFPEEPVQYRSNFKLNPDLREVGRDWNSAIGKVSASVEIDWRAEVLGARTYSAELGGSIDGDGRYGVFVNFVIYSQ